MRFRELFFRAILLACLMPFLGAEAHCAGASGPRKQTSGVPARYSIPQAVLEKPFTFAGEVIPFHRPDVAARIRFQLNFLLIDARSVLTSWLTNKNRYGWMFEEVFGKAEVPEEFGLLAPILSGISAKSSPSLPGAGWWALDTPCTADEGIALSKDTWHDDRLDLELSTRCFAHRIKRIKEKLRTRSWLLTAAAYVSSAEAVEEAGKNWNAFKFWDMPLPPNADELIPRWIALGIISAHPDKFGLRLKSTPPFTYDEVSGLVLAKDLSVADIAEFVGIPARKILRLNPRIMASNAVLPATVKGRPVSHRVIAPKGKGRVLVDALKKNGYLLQAPHAKRSSR